MPARLVYSPKAYVFTKNSTGAVLNLTNYVVSGQVQRLVDQASTAEVVLRNPKKRFTIPKSPAFHPMDPITIFLERLQGYPVQVFTGYLDDTPYYQMYPGTIQLAATCTLKRLLYTYWDPSLPYVNAFLNKFGWINENGSLRNISALSNQTSVAQGNNKSLQDGSIGKLLWATLTDVGDWHDTNIWIEQLPAGDNGIAARMARLMATLATDETTAASEFESFMQQVIGSSSQGSGGTGATPNPSGSAGSTGNVKGIDKIIPTMAAIANAHNIPPLFVVTVWLAEGEITDLTPNSAGARGYFQFTSATPYGFYTSKPINYPQDAGDLGIATNLFCAAAAFAAKSGLSDSSGSVQAGLNVNDQSTWETWAEAVQQPGAGAYSSYWSGKVSQAQQLLSQYGNGTPITGAASTPYVPNSSGGVTTNSLLNGGATVNNSSTTPQGAVYALPLDKKYMLPLGRTDDGVDIENAPDGAPVYSITDGVVTNIAVDPGGFGPNYPVIKVTNGPVAQSPNSYPSQYIYYGHVMASTASGTTKTQFQPGVAAGDTVKAGQIIATIGHTGDAASLGHGHIEIGFSDSGGNPVNHHASSGSAGTPAGDAMRALLNSLVSGNNVVAPGSQGSGASASGQVSSQSNAEAFTAELNFPSVLDMTTAMILGNAHKGLMHDQQLMPFIQQLTQASLRSFQSLPNGDFFAFYPDYFGETNHRKPYWLIHDIEIMSGGINLSDQTLVTHEFAVGDNTYPVNNELINMLFSAGTISVFNAFMDPSAVGIDAKKFTGGMADIMSQAEAVEFIKRYGARPQVSNYPMVRSPLFEMFLAYQQFMLAWSNQFRTPFQFTFMPEVFPGGKVAFPEHGLQMYVNSVTHSWDYEEGGFTTTATLSAPAEYSGPGAIANPDLPPNMVQALVDPIRTAAQIDPKTGNPKSQSSSSTAQQVTSGASSVAQPIAKGTESIVQGILGVF